MALKIEGSSPFTHPIFPSWDPYIGMSPSGKAPDFDSGTRRFKSCHPSHASVSEQSCLCSDSFLCREHCIDFSRQHDPLAQQAEQLPFKQWVWSSNLQRVTSKTPFVVRQRVFFNEINPVGFMKSLIAVKYGLHHMKCLWAWVELFHVKIICRQPFSPGICLTSTVQAKKNFMIP